MKWSNSRILKQISACCFLLLEIQDSFHLDGGRRSYNRFVYIWIGFNFKNIVACNCRINLALNLLSIAQKHKIKVIFSSRGPNIFLFECTIIKDFNKQIRNIGSIRLRKLTIILTLLTNKVSTLKESTAHGHHIFISIFQIFQNLFFTYDVHWFI